jgi:hypothetical protein
MLLLTYISRANHSGRYKSEELAGEVARVSAERNRPLDVSGALIFTTAHFAQILEGPSLSIETLMTKIERDPRHSLVRVLERRHVQTRMFPHWSMAYAGGPVALDEFMAKAIFGDEPAVQNAELLCRLIRQFALSRNAQGRLRGAARLLPSGRSSTPLRH